MRPVRPLLSLHVVAGLIQPSALVIGLWLVMAACSAEPSIGPATGSVRVAVTTAPIAGSPASYPVTIDNRTPQEVGAGGSMTVSDLDVGTHTIVLGGVSGSCTVESGNTRKVEVAAGETAGVSFLVTCGPETGSIAVTVTTSGGTPDPDGYNIVLDGGASRPIAATTTTIIGSLPAGVHSFALEGLAPNCTMGLGVKPKTATVVAGQTAAAAFAVTCRMVEPGWTTLALPPGYQTTGLWASGPTDIYLAAASQPRHNVLLHYDGTSWSEAYHGDPAEDTYPTGVWGLSPSQVFAFGLYSMVRYDGSRWTSGPGAAGAFDGADYEAMWGSSPADLFAVACMIRTG
jgi:hypothetical protein